MAAGQRDAGVRAELSFGHWQDQIVSDLEELNSGRASIDGKREFPRTFIC
jgi:hypothetical protein